MTNGSDRRQLAIGDIEGGVRIILEGFGYSAAQAMSLARRIYQAEYAGIASHGLAMLPRYHDAAKSGRANLTPVPKASARKPGFLVVDCDNGFAPYGLDETAAAFIEMARRQGVAALVTQNALHLSALGPDILQFAEQGLIAIAMSGTAPWVVPQGGHRAILGTNPVAFTCPRKGDAPILWDQASSVVSVSDVRLAQRQGKHLHSEAGLDRQGNPTTDPDEILASGALLPFGGHKGTAIALMVELLTAGLSGGIFSSHYNAAKDGPVNPAGQFYLAIDPSTVSEGFLDHIQSFVEEFDGNGNARIPGDGRLARQSHAQRVGVTVTQNLSERLIEWGWPAITA